MASGPRVDRRAGLAHPRGQRADLTPEDAGQSSTRHGEAVSGHEGKEAGRRDTGTQGESQRPTGTSTARDSTGVDPQEPIEEAPSLQTGDQGG
jgi:hypothetical protein